MTLTDKKERIKYLRASIGEMTYQQQVAQAEGIDEIQDKLESKIILAREEVQRLENDIRSNSDHNKDLRL